MLRIRSTEDLGALVRSARVARGWSQQEAADSAGVSRRFVNRVESGGHKQAEVSRVLSLIQGLGIEIFSTTGDEAPPGDASTEVAESTEQPDDFDLDAHMESFR